METIHFFLSERKLIFIDYQSYNFGSTEGTDVQSTPLCSMAGASPTI